MSRVNPQQYGDTPIFQQLLMDRRGRWPGIPPEELPPAGTSVKIPDGPSTPPPMYRVEPIPPLKKPLPPTVAESVEDLAES